MLEDIKLLLGIDPTDNSKDNLIQLLIDRAIDETLQYTRRNDIYGLESTVENMVIFNYNKLGSEGLNSESYSGISYNYSTDYPESILRVLKKNRKLITL